MAPSGLEQVSALSHDTLVNAERLRQAGLAFARQPRWSPTATSASWRKDALASAIIGHASEVILRGLTERAKQLAIGPAICAQLKSAADAYRGSPGSVETFVMRILLWPALSVAL